jgi:hypothetical protein
MDAAARIHSVVVCMSEPSRSGREAMEVDYAVYGKGEAKLGWFNATLEVEWKGSESGTPGTSYPGIWREPFPGARTNQSVTVLSQSPGCCMTKP